MTIRTNPSDRSTIVTTLRAAGCVFAEEETALLVEAAGSPAELATMVARRAAGDPLEHVVGWAGFTACASPSSRGCSSRAGVPSSWSTRPSP